MVVGCAKPRFFNQQSNLFEVHTKVSRSVPVPLPGAALCALAWGSFGCPCGASPPNRVRLNHQQYLPPIRVPNEPRHLLSAPLPQTGMLWNTEGGSPMVPIGEEDLPAPMLVSSGMCRPFGGWKGS